MSELVTIPEPTEALAPSLAKDSSEASRGLMNIRMRLDFLERNIDNIATSVRTLEPTPDLDVFLMEQLTKDVNILTKRLSDIVDDLLSPSVEDSESLEQALSFEDTFQTLSLKLI